MRKKEIQVRIIDFENGIFIRAINLQDTPKGKRMDVLSDKFVLSIVKLQLLVTLFLLHGLSSLTFFSSPTHFLQFLRCLKITVKTSISPSYITSHQLPYRFTQLFALILAFLIGRVEVDYIDLYSMMFSDSKASNYQRSVYSREQTRPISVYQDQLSTPPKPNLSKSLRWNIEESKENVPTVKKEMFTASSVHLGQPQINNTDAGRGGWDKSIQELKKFNSSKSTRTIKFSSDADKESQIEPIKRENYVSKREEMKGLTMSLGYKTTLVDLMGGSVPYKKEINAVEPKDDAYKRMKNSKSERRIKYEKQEESFHATPIPEFTKHQYVPQIPCKSYKKIETIEQKYARLKQKQEKQPSTYCSSSNQMPAFLHTSTSTHIPQPSSSSNHVHISSSTSAYSQLNKSCKVIKQPKQEPKLEKFKSYQEHAEYDPYDRTHIKRHHTFDNGKPTDSTKKHKLNISDFSIGQCKGEGGFGQVFIAIHKQTRMLVALKKVAKEKVKYMLDQFIQQIKIQMFLNHPNIVQLYGFFDDNTHFYIVMEYMDGGSLFTLIKKNKRLTEEQTADKLREVCLGLKEMHDNSILHRDIKPQNVVLTNDVSKLCDFGWAAVCKDRRTTYCGTLDYVSPEIIEGGSYDDSVDLWCVGVLAYEMICGRTPFYNISRKQTMKRILDVTYDYPPEVSSKAKAFIDRILKKNPNERVDIDQILKDRFLAERH